jgi:hypothetical protein
MDGKKTDIVWFTKAKQWLEFYRQTAQWSEERLREYQFGQLKEILHYALNMCRITEIYSEN